MLVRRLVLDNFRNIRSHEIDTCAKQIILKGENGQGKTNLLEAVYILCYGSSFRTQNLREAVTYGTSFFRLESSFTDAQGLERKTEVTFEDAKKAIRIDGKEIRDRKELIYNLPCSFRIADSPIPLSAIWMSLIRTFSNCARLLPLRTISPYLISIPFFIL